MKLPTLTIPEYRKEYGRLIEENLKLRKHLDQARKDVEFENGRYGKEVTLRLRCLADRKLSEDFQDWREIYRKETGH